MDFNLARYNMVEQQIRPWDVLDFELLDVLSNTPRELFVAPHQLEVAYIDSQLQLPNGDYMLEPKVVARLIQGLALKKTDTVLEIGTGSGYATAILAQLAGHVVSVDIDSIQQQKAREALQTFGVQNIDFVVQNGLTGIVPGAPFDAIYVGGSVNQIPATLWDNLKENGKMVLVEGVSPLMKARAFTRQQTYVTSSVLFDGEAAPLRCKETSTFTF